MAGMPKTASEYGPNEVDPHDVLFQELVSFHKKDAAAQEGLMQLISDVLEWEVSNNDKALERTGGRPARVTVFHGHKPPNISVRAYLERIRTFGGCSACCFALGLRYVEQLQNTDGAYQLNSFNMHRLVLTGIMVAAKFVDDFYFSNNYWAKVGGIPNDELNGLEIEMLFLLNFALHTKRSQYDEYVALLRRRQERISDMQQVQRGMGLMSISGAPHGQVQAQAPQKVTAAC
eukprot:Tamp_18915.p1 GENE.Tamp_18915~~Tamp_18915.p1  ORF type:complete len:232 (+),score=45.34 Tamp_18915:476-1171(+)